MILLSDGVLNSFRAKVVEHIVLSMRFGLSLKWIDPSIFKGARRAWAWTPPGGRTQVEALAQHFDSRALALTCSTATLSVSSCLPIRCRPARR
jgi:hypothetical protein